MPIKVLQTNVGRAYAAQDMAYATARQRGIHILVVCEPNKKRVQGTDWLKDNRVNVAVMFPARRVDVIGHRAGDGHLLLNLRDCDIICCYLSPNIDIRDYKLEVDNIMRLVRNKHTVVLGDLNAKSPQWGSPKMDERGDYWMEMIASRNMVVHNTGLEPTFVRGETTSFIDVTISTSAMAKHIENWEVLETETLTEHQYIYFDILGLKVKKTAENMKRVVNWEAFKDTLEVMECANQEADYETCTRLILQAYRNSLQKTAE